MAEYAIGQLSNVDTFERFRQAISGLVTPTGAMQSRSGIFDSGGVATLAGGMACSVSAFRGYVDGTSGAGQAGYPVVLDAEKTLTFANGGASNRTDIIVARVYDNTYDGSGQTKFAVEIVQGVGGGGVPAVPASAFKIAEKVITAGMSAGTGGLGTAPTAAGPARLVAAGGLLPVASAADRDTIPAWAGRAVFRIDTSKVEVHDGTSWKTLLFVDDTGWINITTFANTWEDIADGSVAASYRRLHGVVYLRGRIKNGTITDDSLLFTLPAGFRPAEDLIDLPAVRGPASADPWKARIRANGRVEPAALSANGAVSLNGLSFPLG